VSLKADCTAVAQSGSWLRGRLHAPRLLCGHAAWPHSVNHYGKHLANNECTHIGYSKYLLTVESMTTQSITGFMRVVLRCLCCCMSMLAVCANCSQAIIILCFEWVVIKLMVNYGLCSVWSYFSFIYYLLCIYCLLCKLDITMPKKPPNKLANKQTDPVEVTISLQGIFLKYWSMY